MLFLSIILVLCRAMGNSVVPVSDRINESSTHREVPVGKRALPDTVLGDVIFEMDVQTATGDFQLLGVEFDGRYFYVTGANGGADPNKVYVLDTLGDLVLALDQPDLPDYWGWRDLAWDGVYAGPDGIDTLYGSYGMMVHKFSIRFSDSTLIHHGSFAGPAHPLNRALAYMADSAWFFTCSGDTLGYAYKFSKTDVRLDSCLSSWFTYGAAYDSDVSEGGYVWWHSQNSSGTPFYCLMEQMDAITMDFTGLVFDYVPSLITSGIAGGLCFYEGFRGMDVLFALVQGDPVDIVVGIFVRQHQPGIAEGYDGKLRQARNVISCWPNPTHGCITISYSIEEPGPVSLCVYDKIGQLVRALNSKKNIAGVNAIVWDGKDDYGSILPAGVYFVKLETQYCDIISKIILTR